MVFSVLRASTSMEAFAQNILECRGKLRSNEAPVDFLQARILHPLVQGDVEHRKAELGECAGDVAARSPQGV